MIREFVSLRADVEQLKSMFGRGIKVGPVAVVDPERGFRIKLGEGEGGEPYLSPWYPHPESGGATKTWAPLSKGQIVGMINPGGDPRQGILLRGGFSDANPPPSQSLGENVFAFGGVTITVAEGGAVTIDAPGTVVVNSPDVQLGGEGGRPVARLGDLVEVASGSSAGRWPIVTAATRTKAL
jgi:hypothetical protein